MRSKANDMMDDLIDVRRAYLLHLFLHYYMYLKRLSKKLMKNSFFFFANFTVSLFHTLN